MALRNDPAGLESLPMRLMVVAVVVSMSVVPAAGALEAFQHREFLLRAGTQMDMIVAAAQILAVEGPGSARTLDVDLSTGGSLRMASIIIGDRPGGPNASAVVLRLSDGASMVRFASDPPVTLSGPAMSALVLTCPRFALRLSAHISGIDVIVIAEVV